MAGEGRRATHRIFAQPPLFAKPLLLEMVGKVVRVIIISCNPLGGAVSYGSNESNDGSFVFLLLVFFLHDSPTQSSQKIGCFFRKRTYWNQRHAAAANSAYWRGNETIAPSSGKVLYPPYAVDQPTTSRTQKKAELLPWLLHLSRRRFRQPEDKLPCKPRFYCGRHESPPPLVSDSKE